MAGRRLSRLGMGLGLAGVVGGCDLGADPADHEYLDGRNVGAFGNDHGYVAVTLTQGEGEVLSVTTAIGAWLYYGGCFEDFYRRSPRWQVGGERGAPVFDSALRADLCVDEPDAVACSVVDIHQNLRGDAKLVIDYEVEGSLDGRRLRVGPLPTRGLADCDPDLPVWAGQLELWGWGADGSVLWTESVAEIPAHQDEPPVLVIDDR